MCASRGGGPRDPPPPWRAELLKGALDWPLRLLLAPTTPESHSDRGGGVGNFSHKKISHRVHFARPCSCTCNCTTTKRKVCLGPGIEIQVMQDFPGVKQCNPGTSWKFAEQSWNPLKVLTVQSWKLAKFPAQFSGHIWTALVPFHFRGSERPLGQRDALGAHGSCTKLVDVLESGYSLRSVVSSVPASTSTSTSMSKSTLGLLSLVPTLHFLQAAPALPACCCMYGLEPAKALMIVRHVGKGVGQHASSTTLLGPFLLHKL